MSRQPISQEIVDKIIELKKQGYNNEYIAGIVGVGSSTVAMYCKSSGEFNRDVENAEIIRLCEQGLYAYEVADILHISKHRVAYVRRNAGIDSKIAFEVHSENRKVAYKKQVQQNVENRYNARLADFINTVNTCVGDKWEYDSGFVSTKHDVRLRCKCCGNVITVSGDTIRQWKRKQVSHTTLHCDVCDSIEKENLRIYRIHEKEHKEYISFIKEATLDYAKKSYVKSYECKNCGRHFEVEYGDRRRSYCCSECETEAKHKKMRLERSNRRKRIKDVLVDRDISLEKLAERDNHTCWLCGGKVDWNDIVYDGNTYIAGNMYPSVDHVIPLAKGGVHSWDNTRLAHRICNSIKNDNDVVTKDDFDSLL